jgi:hypothetical protein
MLMNILQQVGDKTSREGGKGFAYETADYEIAR